MATLAELQKKYPRAKFEPLADCKKCKKEGEYECDIMGHRRVVPCDCIFFSPEFLPIFRDIVKEVRKKDGYG